MTGETLIVILFTWVAFATTTIWKIRINEGNMSFWDISTDDPDEGYYTFLLVIFVILLPGVIEVALFDFILTPLFIGLFHFSPRVSWRILQWKIFPLFHHCKKSENTSLKLGRLFYNILLVPPMMFFRLRLTKFFPKFTLLF
jgi:hypothetical protein